MTEHVTVMQLNFKTPGGTLINLYSDGGAHLEGLLNELNRLQPQIMAAESTFTGKPAPAGPVQQVAAQQPPVQQAPPAQPSNQWPNQQPQQAPPVAHPQGGAAPVTDNWGNPWWYDHPSAPPLPDGSGVYALAEKKKRDGSGTYKVWVDPIKGPLWQGDRKARAEFKLPDGQQWFRG